MLIFYFQICKCICKTLLFVIISLVIINLYPRPSSATDGDVGDVQEASRSVHGLHRCPHAVSTGTARRLPGLDQKGGSPTDHWSVLCGRMSASVHLIHVATLVTVPKWWWLKCDSVNKFLRMKD